MIEQTTETPKAVDAALVALGEELCEEEQEQFAHDLFALRARLEAEMMSHAEGDPVAALPAFSTRLRAELDKAEKDRKEYAAAWMEREHNRSERMWKAFLYERGRDVQAQAYREAAAKGKKTINTPNGRVGRQTVRETRKIVWDEVDEPRVLAAAANKCPDAIQVKRTISKKVLKEYTEEHGEPLEYTRLEVSPKRERFQIGSWHQPEPTQDETPVIGHKGRVDADKFLTANEVPDFGEQT